jgi:hypothetical protein
MTKEDLKTRLVELENILVDAVNAHNELVSSKEKRISESLYNLNTLFGQKREVTEWLNKLESNQGQKEVEVQ